jgi:hypothetical protein
LFAERFLPLDKLYIGDTTTASINGSASDRAELPRLYGAVILQLCR